MNKTLLKDWNLVSSLTEEINKDLCEYVENLELLQQESNILTYIQEFGNRIPSPEAMNDSENIVIRQKRYQSNVGKLQKISEFKSRFLSGFYKPDLDISNHPRFFSIFGKCYCVDENPDVTFYDLHPVAQECLFNYLESVVDFINCLDNRDVDDTKEETEKDDVVPCHRECGGCGCSPCGICSSDETTEKRPNGIVLEVHHPSDISKLLRALGIIPIL